MFQCVGISLVVQWLRLQALNAGGSVSIPAQRTRFRMLQLRIRMLQLRIPHAAIINKRSCKLKILCAATKTRHSQINRYLLKSQKLQFLGLGSILQYQHQEPPQTLKSSGLSPWVCGRRRERS